MNYVQSLTRQYGVSVSGLGYYPNPLDPDPAKAEFYRKHLKATIRAASKLGVSVLNTFIARNPLLNVADNLKLHAQY